MVKSAVEEERTSEQFVMGDEGAERSLKEEYWLEKEGECLP